MIAGDTLFLALRNLRQARLRTTLTTLGVAIGVGALAGMMSLGVGMQEQLFAQFLKSGVFDSITVLPNNPGFGRLPGAPPERRANRNSGKSSAAEKEAKAKPVIDDESLRRFASLKRVKEVYPNLRIPLEVKYGSFSEFTTAVAVPLSARGEGFFQRVSYGVFFANDTEDVCMLSLEFAQRVPGIEPRDLVGKEVILSYASAAGGLNPMQILGGLNVQRLEKPFRVLGIIEREPGPVTGFAMFSSVMIPLRRAEEMGAADISNPQALLQQLSSKRSYGASVQQSCG